MADNHDYLGTSTGSFRLAADVLALMMKGGGYALVFCLVIIVSAWVLVGISRVLPPESKEALDPTPTSFLLMEEGVETSDVA